jgi:chromosomal replication initiator protein
MTNANELWRRAAAALRDQVSEVIWNTCFAELQVTRVDLGTMVLVAPNALVKDRIESRFAELLRNTVHEHDTTVERVAIEVHDQRTASEPTGGRPHDDAAWQSSRFEEAPAADGPGPVELPMSPAPPVPAGPTAPSAAPPRLTGDIALQSRYTFEDFVIGQSNRFASAAALAVAETPARSYNPLFIYGDSGLGKTHLLQAIAHYIRQNYPVMRVRYVSTETFVTEFVDAIRTNQTVTFKRRYRDDCDVLLIDDIQFMGGKEGTQEEFFHTFNFLHNSGRQIVITSDRPPKSIPTLEDRLRNRFEWGLITDITPPDVETREAILRRKAERERVHVNNEVLRFIATNVKDNIRELEGALNRVCAYAFLNGVDLDVTTTERVLHDLLSSGEPRPITSKVILEATAKMFGFAVDDLIGQSRRRPLVTARQTAMYAFRELTDYSYPMIGREFGGRDHTTVIHAVEKISEQMKERRAVYEQVTELIRFIRSGG